METVTEPDVAPQPVTRMPPRPDLSRYMMSVGFMLHPTRFLEECHERCGDYFTLRPAPNREVVFTVDPDAVKQVFTGDPDELHAGKANIILGPILGPGSTLLLDGPEHLRHRRLLLPPFHGERMREYGDVMSEVAQRHIAAWPRDKSFAVLPSMQAITLEIIMRVVFGVDDAARLEVLGKPLRSLLDMLATRRNVLALGLTAGRQGRFSPWTRFTTARAEADALLNEEIRLRRADPAAGEREDIFSMLVSARGEDGVALTDSELRDELMTLLVAGHETTATALAWTLERVSRTPRVLGELISEQRQGGGEYLDAVIKETLRLRPVVPAVVRELQVPMSFGLWDLPAGANIAPSIYLLHRRDDLYPDPAAFKPERFVGRNPGTYEWIPFGGSVRRCLGASFALFEMKTVLTEVLAQVTLSASGARPERTHRRAITFAPGRGGRIAVAALNQTGSFGLVISGIDIRSQNPITRCEGAMLMRRKTRADKAKDAAAGALGKAKKAASSAAGNATDSDFASRAADAARAAEASLMAKAHEAAAAAEKARGRRRSKVAKAHAEATMTEAMTARQELEAKLIEQAHEAAKTARAAAERTEKSPTGRRTRRATKSALKDAKAAAKAQKKARDRHPFRKLLFLVVAGGGAALAASEDLRTKAMSLVGGGGGSKEHFDYTAQSAGAKPAAVPDPAAPPTPSNGSSHSEKAKA